tara:strand:- start:5717 stop:6232 length:516 start_codon:yes stop_codon:yes gene_type:complete
MKKSIVLLFMFALFSTQITAQTKEEKKEQKEQKDKKNYEEMKDLVNSKSFEFTAIWISTYGKRINITSGSNSIEISQDSTKAAMQYFGTVTSVNFSGAEGVKFDNKTIDYNVKFDDHKKKIIVSYSVKNKSETYNIYMSINKTGFAYVDVYSNNKNNVTYDGNIAAIKPKE